MTATSNLKARPQRPTRPGRSRPKPPPRGAKTAAPVRRSQAPVPPADDTAAPPTLRARLAAWFGARLADAAAPPATETVDPDAAPTWRRMSHNGFTMMR